ncbi:HNH endonuclease [Corynebacterium pseudodiphtheriticum]|uniref:HNH endonuclease n=1 Tax=Corynebacterium pseudodiphtheriticum TaxID=37637 RepID=UPI00254DCC64|nr:HNH endonuclease [Corynebacterium pseudodiphtheriticum]MDK8717674.1 HNH endonuclease [Corynebacterium pseudodiphtheriticum]
MNYQAKNLNPNAFEADHYQPRSTHPELTLDMHNLRPAHVSCNRSRGTKQPQINLGPTTTNW